jgi:hypothetical protein
MEMLAFPDINMRGNGQNGKKGCWQKKGMSGKFADIDVSAQHVADMLPTFPTKAIGRLECALDNLAPTATNNSAVLQQLTVANLALTTTVTALMATNKTLVDLVAKARAAANPMATTGSWWSSSRPWPKNYCWMHDHWLSKERTSATCRIKAVSHRDDATMANMMGVSNRDKGWKQRHT